VDSDAGGKVRFGRENDMPPADAVEANITEVRAANAMFFMGLSLEVNLIST